MGTRVCYGPSAFRPSGVRPGAPWKARHAAHGTADPARFSSYARSASVIGIQHTILRCASFTNAMLIAACGTVELQIAEIEPHSFGYRKLPGVLEHGRAPPWQRRAWRPRERVRRLRLPHVCGGSERQTTFRNSRNYSSGKTRRELVTSTLARLPLEVDNGHPTAIRRNCPSP